MVRNEGALSLYKGVVAPLLGNIVLLGVHFPTFSNTRAQLEKMVSRAGVVGAGHCPWLGKGEHMRGAKAAGTAGAGHGREKHALQPARRTSRLPASPLRSQALKQPSFLAPLVCRSPFPPAWLLGPTPLPAVTHPPRRVPRLEGAGLGRRRGPGRLAHLLPL